jgi:hypothetical protein
MAFANYARVDDVIRTHKIRWQSGPVVTPDLAAPPFSVTFRNELDINLSYLPVRSGLGTSEVILFPILREVWKEYREVLSLFPHKALEYDTDLTGDPDYFVCPRSEFGPFYPTPPYLLIVEAKLDDFAKAWGQCLAAMLAAQKLNGTPEQSVYGIATNGKAWEFAVLKHTEFTQQQEPFALADLDNLARALHAVFRACRGMALAHTLAPTTP